MKKVVVVGAGIVGICCALELCRQGCEVMLIDRGSPGGGTSSGNAGVISTNGIAPYPGPGMLSRILHLGFNRDPRVKFHWPHFFELLPNLIRFLGNCNQKSYAQGVAALSYLLRDAMDLHRQLLRESNAESLFNDTGWLRLYRSEETFAQTDQERTNYDQYGVPYKLLDAGEIRELEPDIAFAYHKAIWLTRTPSVYNPEKLCRAYFDLYRSLGGLFANEEARQLRRRGTGWEVTTGTGRLETSDVLVCMGAHSNQLLATIGLKMPLFIERGYHLLYQPAGGKSLTRSILDAEQGLCITPMDMGIRVTSAVNIVATDTDPHYDQILNLIPQIERIFPMSKRLLDEPWMGRRPSTPDSLPIIGPMPDHPGLCLAFGHQHLGLTAAPKTGKLIAAQMLGKPVDNEASAFSPGRF